MATLVDRLLGRTSVKAVTGTGAYWMEHGVSLQSISRDPGRLIAEAERVYRTNEWVNAAESLIDAKFATVPWHVEDAKGDSVEGGESWALLRAPAEGLTRTHLWRLTCRHMGLTGNSFWYLDQQDNAGIPLRIIYLNPARMTPATDARGQLRGWIVDADRPNGVEPVPLEPEEVIHFVLDPPDFGYYGIGKVEAAWRKIGLSNSSGSFLEGQMLSGGRKAHLIWPDGVTVEGDQWNEWISSLRTAQEDGSFTRRLTANRFPVGSVETGQTVSELQVPDISKMSRDDILAIWGVPPSQLGITESRGLNSGETQKYEEAALWQNAIEPRLTVFAEQLQARLFDPVGLTLVLETPAFDDEAPLYEIANNAKSVPLTVDQRRALVSQDPLDPALYGPLGASIFIDQSMVPIGGSITGAGPVDEELPEPAQISAKATLTFTGLRERMERAYIPRYDRAVSEVLNEQRESVIRKVQRNFAQIQAKPNDWQAWWVESAEHERLAKALDPAMLVREVGTKTSAAFFTPAKAEPFLDRVLSYVSASVASRVREINTTTRNALRTLIAQGISEGLSPAELGERIREGTMFNANRAELIARTETMLAYNDAALGTYRAHDVEQVQAIDGDQDDECAARNGSVFTLAEASGITDHPNGTLDWVPIVKASLPVEPTSYRVPDVTVNVPEATSTKAIEELAAAFRHQEPPRVTVTPASVPVDTTPFADAIRQMTATLTPPPRAKRRLVPVRDERGLIVSIDELYD